MKAFCRVVVIVLFVLLSSAYAEAPLPDQKEFMPESGKGRVVIVVSGTTGTYHYQTYAKHLAEQGYYAVLVDSNDFWKKEDGGGKDLLRGVIERAQQSSKALPGKVAVIGFSLGGGVSLNFATKMPDLVSAVVVNYPLTNFIKNPKDYVSKFKVPTLMIAGGHDTFKNCCRIEKAHELDDAARAYDGNAMFKLVVYPGAEHAFDIISEKAYRMSDADDAFHRALDFLRERMGT